MDVLKKIVTLIAVMVAGYFLYQYFIITPEEESYEEEDAIPAYMLPSIPEACQPKVQKLEKAIYGHGSHQASAAQLNRTHRELESCLRDSGFSDAEIRGTIEQIRIKVQGYLRQDGY